LTIQKGLIIISPSSNIDLTTHSVVDLLERSSAILAGRLIYVITFYYLNFTAKIITEVLLMADFDQELDACGLNCPLPILRAKKSLSSLESGQVLRIIATDPGSVKDFEAFAKQTGNELLESSEEAGKFHFLVKKK